jgi:hypothetical protein
MRKRKERKRARGPGRGEKATNTFMMRVHTKGAREIETTWAGASPSFAGTALASSATRSCVPSDLFHTGLLAFFFWQDWDHPDEMQVTHSLAHERGFCERKKR